MPGICALIPAFNNGATIARVVSRTAGLVERVIVVDDGSVDDTASRAERAGARVIRLACNRGKGHALRAGFAFALGKGFQAAVTLDGDLQHDPAEIPKFIDCYRQQGAGIVIGNRMRAGQPIPRYRYGPNKVGVVLFSWLTGQVIADSQCGFRLYDSRVMRDFPIRNDGFEAEADILLRAALAGRKVAFVPVKAIYAPQKHYRSAYRPVKDTFRISIMFLRNLFWTKT